MSPFNQLRNSSRTEGIGSNQHNFFAFLFVFMCQLTNGSRFTNPINTNKKHNRQTILEINMFLVNIVLLVDIHKFFNNQALQILSLFDILKSSFIA